MLPWLLSDGSLNLEAWQSWQTTLLREFSLFPDLQVEDYTKSRGQKCWKPGYSVNCGCYVFLLWDAKKLGDENITVNIIYLSNYHTSLESSKTLNSCVACEAQSSICAALGRQSRREGRIDICMSWSVLLQRSYCVLVCSCAQCMGTILPLGYAKAYYMCFH